MKNLFYKLLQTKPRDYAGEVKLLYSTDIRT